MVSTSMQSCATHATHRVPARIQSLSGPISPTLLRCTEARSGSQRWLLHGHLREHGWRQDLRLLREGLFLQSQSRHLRIRMHGPVHWRTEPMHARPGAFVPGEPGEDSIKA